MELERLYTKRNRISVEIKNDNYIAGHFHQELELIFVMQGTVTVTADSGVSHLQKEDIRVINPNCRHEIKASANSLFAQITFSYALIADISTKMYLAENVSEKFSEQKYDELRCRIKDFLNYYLQIYDKEKNFEYIALGYQILHCLSENFLETPDDKLSKKQNSTDNRIYHINNYIRTNYDQPISLKNLAEHLYLSTSYLARFFRKTYGMTFLEYLTKVRMQHAVEDLLYTDIPVTKIVYTNGFSNSKAFNKTFKAFYGCTTSEYRKNFKTDKEKSSEATDMKLVKRMSDYFLENMTAENKIPKSDKDVEVICRADVRQADRQLYGEVLCDTVNIGMAADLLKSEVQEHVLLLQKQMHITYVRFWNIFSPEMMLDIHSEKGTYNFSRLNQVLDFLAEHKLKAHIELGAKPRRLMRDLKKPLNEIADSDSHREQTLFIKDWTKICDALMENLKYRYGNLLNTWRMELWFPETKWGDSNAMNEYFKIFETTKHIIQSYNTRLQFGGCGLKFDYSKLSMQQFLSQWAKQKCTPDFVSALYYAYEPEKEISDVNFRKSTDIAHMKKCAQNLRKMLDENGMAKVPVYFTEWNMTVSDRNYMNDSCYKACWMIKNQIECYPYIQASAYFIGSDYVTEYYDSNELLHGGTGLLSKDGIIKPSGYALQFLNELYGNIVAQNEQYMLTTDNICSYKMICHNVQKLDYKYYFTGEDCIKKEELEHYFENYQTMKLSIMLTGLADGPYRIKIMRVNQQQGSVLDVWKEMNFEKYMTHSDIQYLRNVCVPRRIVQKQQIKDGRLNFDIHLEPDEFASIWIEPMER